MIKNLIFDFGGILVNLDKDVCSRAFNAINAGEVARYVDYCIQEDLFHELEIGRISVPQFCDEVRKKAPLCKASDAEIVAAWASLLTGVPTHRLERLLDLKRRYRLFLLSNTNEIHWRLAEEEYFRQIEGKTVSDYFEDCCLSHKLGMIKPGKEIFLHLLDKNGINADETLFIDDSPKNCQGAESVGIHAFHSPNGEWEQTNCF
ncbi:MAG: HAD family phosphatase [Bacteroidaceae bacterium]|nr:HAD family phosphatase [Bacteroidaceae bacterium]